MGSGNMHPIIIRTAPRFAACNVHTTVNCPMGLGSCLHADYHLLTAVIPAHSLPPSPCNGWMGCSGPESQSSAACRGSWDNWTRVSSSSSLLSPPRRYPVCPRAPPADARGVLLLNDAAGEKWTRRLLSSFTHCQTLCCLIDFHSAT